MESTMFLEINDLKKSFGQGDSRVQVLRGIDLSVDKGEICVLLGPSGSGKSTLLNIIGGIATFIFLIILGKPTLKKLDRLTKKYNLS